MKKILVGYDGSEQGRDAIHLADALRTAFGSELLVAVVDEVGPVVDDMPTYGAERAALFTKKLAEAREELAGATFVERTGVGSVPAVLEEIATAEEADMIVLGSTHRGGLGRVLPGSVGDRLLNGGPCAIAVAPRGFSARHSTGSSTLAVGYDGGAESRAALSFAEELAQGLGWKLLLVAVARSNPAASLHAPGIPRDDADLRSHLAELLREARGTLSPETPTESTILTGEPAAQLAHATNDADLLVVGSRGYGPLRRVLMGGVAREVIRAAHCPVVVVPRRGE